MSEDIIGPVDKVTNVLVELGPPSNQLLGMAVCQRAAQLLGEDYEKEPWN